MWNTALWRKSWGDQRGLVLSLSVLWLVFPWIYIWLSSQIEMSAFQDVLLRAIPKNWQRLSSVPFADIATHSGRVALALVYPVVVLAATVWGITRGSDAVSGQLERGTMEMVLAQPVSRTAVYITQAIATTSAAALLCAVLYFGLWSGLTFGPWSGKVDPRLFIPAVANVFGLMFCTAGLTACISAADSYRWRTIGMMCGFHVFSILAKLVGRMSSTWGFAGYLSVLNAFEPQQFVADPDHAWQILLLYDGILLGIGVAAYALGTIIFANRDLPAPL